MYTSYIVRILYSNNNHGQKDEDNDDDHHGDINSSVNLYKISRHNIHCT